MLPNETNPGEDNELPPIPAENEADRKIPVSEDDQLLIKQLASDIAVDAGSITEKDFVERLLPVLTDTSGKADISVWTDYAGIMQRPLNVIGPDGKILFTCPPPLGQLPTLQAEDRANQVAEVIGQSQAQSSLSPQMGARYLEGKLNQRAEAMDGDTDRHTLWLRILAHYGYVTDETPKEALTNSPQATNGALSSALSDEDEPL